jgi:hypothetical protein
LFALVFDFKGVMLTTFVENDGNQTVTLGKVTLQGSHYAIVYNGCGQSLKAFMGSEVGVTSTPCVTGPKQEHSASCQPHLRHTRRGCLELEYRMGWGAWRQRASILGLKPWARGVSPSKRRSQIPERARWGRRELRFPQNSRRATLVNRLQRWARVALFRSCLRRLHRAS